MKLSKIIVLLFLIVTSITIFFFIKNENRAKSIIEVFNKGQFPITEYNDYMNFVDRGVSAFCFSCNHELTITIRKKEIRNEILLRSGGILIVFLVIFILIKSNENKVDPIKNLENLKQNKIISESEYHEKIKHSKIVENKKRMLKSKKREFKKLVSELDNLKAKGILSEKEYQEKLIKIKEKTA